MPFRGPEAHLTDIKEYSEHILEFTKGFNLDAYSADLITKSAVERWLQIITEAAVRLGDDAEILCPGLDWPKIRGLGIVLRHVYQSVDDGRIWARIQTQIPVLLTSVSKALESFE